VSGTVGDGGGGSAPAGAVKAATATRTVSAAPKIRLSCSTRGSGHKITISCSAKGADAAHGATALRFRIVKRNKVLATGAAKLSHSRAKVTLRSKQALKQGRYTLRIAISHAGGVAGVSRTITRR
jgi:phospholipase C